MAKGADTAWGPVVRVAMEQSVPAAKRLVDDGLAYRFLPASLRALVAVCRVPPFGWLLAAASEWASPGVTGGILCRKRYIQDQLRQALRGGMRSVVILGAGFDTLAYRLSELSSCRVVEADLVENVQLKRATLERVLGRVPDHVELVALDLRDGLSRLDGHWGNEPVFLVWEGVTQYLPEEAVGQAFQAFRQSLPGSRLAFTYVREDFIAGRERYGLDVVYRQAVLKGLWQFGLAPEGVEALMAGYGWRLVEQVGSEEYEARYLRPLGRRLKAMPIERAVLAEKVADDRNAA